MMSYPKIDVNKIIPNSASEGTWIGRCYVPSALAFNGVEGPHVVKVFNNKVYDLSEHFSSTSELINSVDLITTLGRLNALPLIGSLSEILENSIYFKKEEALPHFISPNDIQSVKACGVTFIESLLERVIEEKAKGDASIATKIRATITKKIGANLGSVTPGSEKAMRLKNELQELGLWSQYLEVGIGKDAEVFTKAQPLSSVGFGMEIGVLGDSNWNNPEPEVVLVVSKDRKIKGATLGNDVNLRDYEGRSALLLGEAKDQNGSCSVGPLFRLFDDTFNLDIIKEETIYLKISGEDGFTLNGSSKMNKISRTPESLVAQTIGENHQYPDGLILFCGTMFAPTKDRGAIGLGFTHKIHDKVEISSRNLGSLINWVNKCDQIPRWEFGIGSFIKYLIKRK